MSKTLERVVTSAGKEYRKIEDSLGRIQYRAEGETGAISQQRFAAAASNTTETQVLERGNLGGIEALKAGEIEVEDLGGHYSKTLTDPVNRYERGSADRKAAAETNRWLGFYHSENTPDDKREAAIQYHEMKQRLAEANTEEQEQEIKRDYNIGGS